MKVTSETDRSKIWPPLWASAAAAPRAGKNRSEKLELPLGEIVYYRGLIVKRLRSSGPTGNKATPTLCSSSNPGSNHPHAPLASHQTAARLSYWVERFPDEHADDIHTGFCHVHTLHASSGLFGVCLAVRDLKRNGSCGVRPENLSIARRY